jgi:hypothetical protein
MSKLKAESSPWLLGSCVTDDVHGEEIQTWSSDEFTPSEMARVAGVDSFAAGDRP